MKKLFNEFKEFAMRGNVMDMAVGVVIGAAFGKITTSLVNDVFMPLIGLLIGGIDLGQLNIVLKPEVLDEAGEVVTAAVTLGLGTFLSTILDFILVAFVIFLVVKAINKLHTLGKKDEEPEPEEPETPTITLVSISSRTGSVRTGGTSAGASAAPEVEQVTPSALMVTYSFSCTAS